MGARLMNILSIIAAVLAVLAAVLWFMSAAVKTPDSFSVHVVRPREAPLGGDPLGGTYIGQAHSQDFTNLANALRRQSRLSSYAAICAGASALVQGASMIASFLLPRSG